MRDSDLDRAREILLEAFTAGWQAGLARKVKDPRALAVVEGCFDLWLADAIDETEVFGLVFRGREDLPPPAGTPSFLAGLAQVTTPDATALMQVPPQRHGEGAAPQTPQTTGQAPGQAGGEPAEQPASRGRSFRTRRHAGRGGHRG